MFLIIAQGSVKGGLFHQGVMGALSYQTASFQQDDPVRTDDAVQSVGNDKTGDAGMTLVHVLQDQAFIKTIQLGGGFIQNQDGFVA